MNDKVNEITEEEVTDETAAGAAEEAAIESAEQSASPGAAVQSDTPDAANGGERRRKGRSWLTSLFLFILLAAVATAAGYFIFDISKGRKANEAQLKSLADRLDMLQQSHDDLSAGIRRLAGRQDGIDDQLTGILHNLSSLRRQESGDVGWQLAEAGYLFRIASLRLALAGDAETAQAILLSADASLREIPDPALIPVREQLIADINRLKSAAGADFTGLALALGDLAGQADRLPLSPGGSATQPPPPVDNPAGTENRWHSLALGIWKELKSLVVISRTESNSVALLAPRERFFLHRNLRLQLEAARLALLVRDENQFRVSVNACMDWLTEFFDTGDARVRNAMEILERAAASDLNEPALSIDATLNAFDEYLARQDNPSAGGAALQ